MGRWSRVLSRTSTCANLLRTGVLLAALTALFMAVGYLHRRHGRHAASRFVVALGTNLFAYWNADKMVLSMQNAARSRSARGARPSTAWSSGWRAMPACRRRASISSTPTQPNAFATGRNPQNAAVAVSSGPAAARSSRDEVAAVIAHELAHIKHRDTLTMTITATLAGAISMLAQFGLFFGGGNRRNNPLGGIGALLMVFLAPLAAALVQMAVSRTREYEADRGGAEISGEPLALASALRKISSAARRTVNVAAERNPAMAHLYIFNPLQRAAHGQSLRHAPGGREPHRGAAADRGRDGPIAARRRRARLRARRCGERRLARAAVQR